MGVLKKKCNRNTSAGNQNDLVEKNIKHRILKNTVLPTKIKLSKIQCKVTEKISNYNKLYIKNCSHGYSQKCQYCEEEKRKQMQLRRYKVNK